MDKGWGLALENSDQVGLFFKSKSIFGFNLSPRLNSNKGTMFSGTGSDFPASINPKEEPAAGSSPAGEKREVDFFSDHKKKSNEIVVKKENSHGLHQLNTSRPDLNVNTGLQLVTANTGSDQSTVDDGVSSDQMDDQRAKVELVQLQAELERMNAENQRLRGMLSQVSNNYSALQMHLVNLMQQQQLNSRAESSQNHEGLEKRSEENMKVENGALAIVPRQFLDLGPNASGTVDRHRMDQEQHSLSSSEERTLSGSPRNNNMEASRFKGIHAREESPESEGWGPNNKVPKTLNSSNKSSLDQAAEATMRKARVSVRARSEAPMITDGCQWRKYGQKMAKGNPCPRAYYRCTMAVGCPVRKQVQRCAEDRTILITTYEGTHNHPLPPAAMAMASTTSAAANMLLSGSMSSADGLINPNFLARAILPCSSSMATISASAPFPTVTLDLTQNANSLTYPRPLVQFHAPFATPNQALPTSVMQNPQLPQIFGQGLYNQSKFSGLQLSQDSLQQPHQQNPPSFADTLSAATAAITADPNFTAALAAAISSIIGGSQPNSSPGANNSINVASSTSSLPGN